MATRTTLKSTTTGAITGDAYMDNVSAHIGVFYNASTLRLTSIGGTADAVTAVVDPVLDVGLVAGMSFWFTPTANNTGAMTLVIGSESAVNIVAGDGAALVADDVVSGTLYLLHFDGTELRIIFKGANSASGAFTKYEVFTGAGTLTKPVGFPDDGLVIIEMWGGGGGGGATSNDGGGGGGAYNRKEFRGADLGATEAVSVGSGGAVGVAGGNSSVGSLISAFGGGPGNATLGGGGGGQISAGAAAAIDGEPVNAMGIFGGGRGGPTSTDGTSSIYGGGGGAADGGGAVGGQSAFGGDGGDPQTAGSVPGGGGGGWTGAGARGEVRVRWVG